MSLAIITACTRPENLARIGQDMTGDVRWIVVMDCESDVPIDGVNILRYAGTPKSRAGGQHAKNFGLERALNDPSITHVYFLDDDNVLHPDFLPTILPLVAESETELIVFAQDLGDATWIRPPVIKVGSLDQAQYVVRVSAIKKLRIPETYTGDGEFAVMLKERGCTVGKIDRPLAYYNRLYKDE